eukprot:GFUD01026560.1.p1 GENE.GFUD01026560.1~~GFUD01026560.1.p1  ORF type:complete len:375 (-),score=101.94 GFUD01026560.1:24-1148(-)
MAGRFFSFHLSGYESYLAENIASSVHVGHPGDHAVVGAELRVVCGGGGGGGADQAVVVDRLLLVLLHPFYRDILENKDSSTIIIPDISLDQLAADLFGEMMGFCGQETCDKVKEELNTKTEQIEIDCDVDDGTGYDDDGNDAGYNDGDEECLAKEIKESLSSESLCISFDYNPEQVDNSLVNQNKILKNTFIEVRGDKRGQRTCPKCYKKYNNRSIPYRCECDHILGGKFVSTNKKQKKCPECDYQVYQRNAVSVIKKHYDAIHANISYSCEFCDYKSGYKQVLKKHVESLHKGTKYSCKECDYTNKFESGLFQHVQAVHRGVRYMCQFCGHQAIQSSALRKHEKAKHKEELEKLGKSENSRSRFKNDNIIFSP